MDFASYIIPDDVLIIEHQSAVVVPSIDANSVITMLLEANKNFRIENDRLKAKIGELQKRIESFKCITDKLCEIRDLLPRLTDDATPKETQTKVIYEYVFFVH